MSKIILMVLLTVVSSGAWAGAYEDGDIAYERKDYTEAMKLFRQAAMQGGARAQLNLGDMYDNGLGFPRDYAKAVKWYRLAAKQGSSSAQVNLGILYANGQGVLQDDVLAYSWFNLAETSGNVDAAKGRDLVARKMTPTQIAEAQKMARDCLANDYKGCD